MRGTLHYGAVTFIQRFGDAAQGGGAIVNNASMLGVAAEPYSAAYTATKFGVVGLTKVIAAEPDNSQILASGIPQQYAANGDAEGSHPVFRPHVMQGWSPDFIPKLTEDVVSAELIDEILNSLLFLLIGFEVLAVSGKGGFLFAALIALAFVVQACGYAGTLATLRQAVELSGRSDLAAEEVTVGLNGDILQTTDVSVRST